jgi:hypothetical protein
MSATPALNKDARASRPWLMARNKSCTIFRCQSIARWRRSRAQPRQDADGIKDRISMSMRTSARMLKGLDRLCRLNRRNSVWVRKCTTLALPLQERATQTGRRQECATQTGRRQECETQTGHRQERAAQTGHRQNRPTQTGHRQNGATLTQPLQERATLTGPLPNGASPFPFDAHFRPCPQRLDRFSHRRIQVGS